MAVKYGYVKEALILQIGNSIFEGQGKLFLKADFEWIPCQYHGLAPKGGNHKADRSWEGARAVRRNGKITFEYYTGVSVCKAPDGRCLIPKTPNNEARLNAMKNGREQYIAIEKIEIPGQPLKTQRVRKWRVAPALYTRLPEDQLGGGDITSIVNAAVQAALQAREDSELLPADEPISTTARRVAPAAGMVDVEDEAPAPTPALGPAAPPVQQKNLGQPAAPVAGGDVEATPPAEAPQPTPQRGRPRSSLSPSAVAAAAAEAGEEF